MAPISATLDFRKLLITSTLHGSPTAHTSARSAPESIQASEGFESTTVPAVNTAALIAKDVAETFSSVPYVKAIAGVIAQLARIQDEIRLHKRRCNELLEKVFLRSRVVLENLLEIKGMVEEPEFKKLSEHLASYHELLEQIFALITKLTKRNTFSRILDRGLDELNEMDRRIDSYADDILLSNSMAQLRHLIKKGSGSLPPLPKREAEPFAYVLPPAPLHLIGRETERTYLLTTLLGSSPTDPATTPNPNPKAAITILGPGGIGKTTLATSLLHDPQITAVYPQRYFISFEGLTTAEAVYTAFAATFGLQPGQDEASGQQPAGMQLLMAILEHLKKERTLLVLDNFDSFWEPPATRRKAEETLQYLAGLETVSMVVTMRGTQRPRGVNWSQPFMEPLKPLTIDGSRELMDRISGIGEEEAEYANKLLDAVEGLPLAITLISYLLQDGNETPQSLWERWCREQTRMIEDLGPGGALGDRLSKLDISIEVSLNSPRMKAIPEARVILSALAILPDGMSSGSGWVQELQGRLDALDESSGVGINLRKCTTTLLNVSLLSTDKSTTPPRYKLLSPIRQYCLGNLPPHASPAVSSPANDAVDQEIKNDTIQYEQAVLAVVEMYTTFAGESTSEAMSVVHAKMIPEVNNIRAILETVFSPGSRIQVQVSGSPTDSEKNQEERWKRDRHRLKLLVVSAVVYTNWTNYLGTPMTDTEILNQAIDYCDCWIPTPLPSSTSTTTAASPTSPAANPAPAPTLNLHLSLKADALQILGKVNLRQNQPLVAIESSTRARVLHSQLGQPQDEAQDLVDLGLAYTKLSRWEEAEGVLGDAIGVFTRMGDKYEEAGASRRLGELYLARYDAEEASGGGEGGDGKELLYKAEKTLERSLALDREMIATPDLGTNPPNLIKANSRTFESTDLGLLARVYEARGTFEDAECVLLDALRLARDAHQTPAHEEPSRGPASGNSDQDKLGELGSLVRLAMFYMRRDRWDEAVKSYQEALAIAEEVGFGGLASLEELRQLWLKTVERVQNQPEGETNEGVRDG